MTGIYDGPMERADAIVGVLKTSNGDRELWKAYPEDILPHMTRSPVQQNQLQVSKKVLREHGELITTIPAAGE